MASSRKASTPSPKVAGRANKTAKNHNDSKKRAPGACYFPEARFPTSAKKPVYPQQLDIEPDPTVTSFEVDARGYPTGTASKTQAAYLGGTGQPFKHTEAAGNGKSRAAVINVPWPGSDAYPRDNPHYSDNASEPLQRWVKASPSAGPYNNVVSVKALKGKGNNSDYPW